MFRTFKHVTSLGRLVYPLGNSWWRSSLCTSCIARKDVTEVIVRDKKPVFATSAYRLEKNVEEHCGVEILPRSIQLNSKQFMRIPESYFAPVNLAYITPLKPVPVGLPTTHPVKETPVDDNLHRESVEAPAFQIEEKRAARLIVIRRKKMKKHKLKKLRIKMKFEWAKVRQKREMRKEKAFQAELMAQIKEAQKFDPEEYARNLIRKTKERPIPRYWKGRRLPRFIVKQKLGLE